MSKKKVLIVTQEMEPYTTLSHVSKVLKDIPKHISSKGMDVRILMPRYGVINERRHRLHEVVRLSGMNIIVDNDDYPLIIKVASLPGARLQVYFLDNDEFFGRKHIFEDEGGVPFDDNADRMVFFCKGVMETVRKFGWPPDIIHCHGWMTSLIPLYMKTAYGSDPIFKSAKMVYSIYESPYQDQLKERFADKAAINNIEDSDLESYIKDGVLHLEKGAIHYSDAVVLAHDEVDPEIKDIVSNSGGAFVDYDENYLDSYTELYKRLVEE